MRRTTKLQPHFAQALPREDELRGREAQVEAVTRRVLTGEPGVVALVGLGGAGKTVLLGQILEGLSVPEGPYGVFVWTFYRDPDVDRFLREAFRYFTGRETTSEGSLGHVYALTLALKDFGPAVIAVDGLERMQSFEADAPGRIEDPALRVLLEKLAEGVGEVVCVATTRIAARELVEQPAYEEVSLDMLPEEAGAALLADRGVTGDDDARRKVVATWGRHPLTLTLLGRLIAEYYRGDPAAQVAEGVAALDAEMRLRTVLRSFEARLSRTECAIVQRMAAFRGDVTTDLIGKVLLEPVQAGGFVSRFKNWWGDPLGRLDVTGLIEAIDHLESLKLLHREGERDGRTVYAFHAAIKDHFYDLLLAGGTSGAIHEHVRAHLSARPMARKPETEDELDRMEELLFHTIECGKLEDAFRVYWDRLEGYEHLGRTLGAYTRGRRIATAFFANGKVETPKPGLPPWQAAMMAGDLGLYLEKLGELDEAIECHVVTHSAARDAQDAANSSVSLQNQASILILQGQLVEARRIAARAQTHAERAGDDDLRAECLTLAGAADGLSGRALNGLAAFSEAERMLKTAGLPSLQRRRACRQAQVLLRMGDAARALVVLDANLATCERHGWRQDVALCQVLRTDALREGDHARKAWIEAQTFAMKAGIQELVAACHLAGARLLRRSGEPDAAVEQVVEGIKVARRVGFGIMTVDLLVLAGHMQADASDERALETAREAHNVASRTSSGYLWGQADALELLCRLHQDAGRDKELGETQAALTKLRARLQEGGRRGREEEWQG